MIAKTKTRVLSLILCVVLLLGVIPFSVSASYEEETEVPIPVTAVGKTYSLYTKDNLEEQHGVSFLYVIKSAGRYYTPAHPGVYGYSSHSSIPALDITEYWDEQTGTFSNIPADLKVGVMQYQTYPFPYYGGTGLYLDGNILFSLSVPFEDDGSTWFGSINYYDRHETYSYSRALWEATGDGSGYFYDSYYNWYGNRTEVHGALALTVDSLGNRIFALRNVTEERMAEEIVNVGGYLYAAPCGHVSPTHSAYVAPTCMDKGCKEYWHCVYCDGYFSDAACRSAYPHKPVLPALEHDYDETECANCHNPLPRYTKITSYEQFRTIKAGASFIAVAEIDDGNGGKNYFVLKRPDNFINSDVDEDGAADILSVDNDQSGVADVLEQDRDGDGVADAMGYDGFMSDENLDGVLDEEEIIQYLYDLEREYTNGYMVDARVLEPVGVTPNGDGTITVKDLGALEFVMERKIPDSLLGEQYYGDGATVKDYENDFIFRIPNFWVRPMVTLDNNFYQGVYEQGDSKWWGVLFGKDGKELNPEHFADYPDDAALLYTEAFYSLNGDGDAEHALRFLVDGENQYFIITSQSYWEEIAGTQIPIYLYSSDAGGEIHEHVFGDWASYSEENHRRFCTVDGCSYFEIGGHVPGEECTPDSENIELGHWVTCTVCNGQFHEYHTREEAGRYYPNYWRDTGDGVHHVVYCTECLGPVEYAEHEWSEWYRGSKEIDGEWVMGHYMSCDEFPCEAQKWQKECIYDEGVMTLAPTCTEMGVRTYTCIAEQCELETRVYTEEIPALDHAWGEWTLTEDPTVERRVCKNDASHVEERGVVVHTHDWMEWKADETADTHSRSCTAEDCNATETAPHGWGEGVQTKDPECEKVGTLTFTCSDCKATKTEDIPALDHDWSDWSYDSVDSHVASCKRNCGVEKRSEGHQWSDWSSADGLTHTRSCSVCKGEHSEDHEWDEWIPNKTDDKTHIHFCICNESETAPHKFDEGVITTKATHTSKGVMTYTCTECGYSYEEEIPETAEHEWTKWSDNGDGTHTRSCRCNANETKDCVYDNGEITQKPTHVEKGVKTYTCTDCGHSYEKEVDTLTDHEWDEWIPNKTDDETHIHFCICNESETAPHKFDEGVVTTKATHTSKGVMTYTCTECGYSYEEEIPETAEHEWTKWSDNGNGTHTRSCRCNANETKDCVYDHGEITQKPTHVEKGVKTYTCTDCGGTKTEAVEKTEEHLWGDWAATNDGKTHLRECKCGATETASHAWGEWEEQQDGSYQRVCTDCGALETMILDEEKPVNSTPADNAANTNLADSDIELIDKILTDEEQSQVADGADVKVYLKVEDISDDAPAEHKAEAEAKAGDSEIGMYLDINLFKQVGDEKETQVTQTNGKVTVSIIIPAELINTDASVTRTYKIIRVHEDANGNLITEVIEGVFNPEDNSFTFETDQFSTYALAYSDEVGTTNPAKPSASAKPSGSAKPSQSVTPPQTGDKGSLWLWIALAAVSGASAFAISLKERKRSAR